MYSISKRITQNLNFQIFDFWLIFKKSYKFDFLTHLDLKNASIFWLQSLLNIHPCCCHHPSCPDIATLSSSCPTITCPALTLLPCPPPALPSPVLPSPVLPWHSCPVLHLPYHHLSCPHLAGPDIAAPSWVLEVGQQLLLHLTQLGGTARSR